MSYYDPNFNMIQFGDLMMQIGEAHLRNRGFLRVPTPRIVPASGACENVDTLFEVTVNGDPRWFHGGQKRAYIAQTCQLYLESMLGQGGKPKLYCVGPSARAEATIDNRHLTEFEMVEIEFRGSFSELLLEINLFINALVDATKKIPEADRADYGLPTDLKHLENHPLEFPRIRYADAIAELGLPWGADISSDLEKALIANHGQGPILITHYPNPASERMKLLFDHKVDKLAIKFFNMLPDPENPEYVLSCDCIVPAGGECVGSAARVHELAEFQTRLLSSPMFKRLETKDAYAKEGFAWYLHMLEKFPAMPHAGCGFGMSRIYQYLLNETDITKVVVLPSNRARLY
ncbi:MAG: amino acid--tRNA ligase-related protein [Patescibacteria group bacterium]|jgi:aspartyl/asparaginyl-tRNA synthetase